MKEMKHHTGLLASGLRRAEETRYHRNSLRELPAGLAGKYFSPAGDSYILAADIISMVEFRRCDIMKTPLESDWDLILCRYLFFTYFAGRRRSQAFERLYQPLRPGGALMIGKKEQLEQHELEYLSLWGNTTSIFRKRTRKAAHGHL